MGSGDRCPIPPRTARAEAGAITQEYIDNGGDDRLTGGEGDDVFLFGAGDGSDRVLDFVGGADRLRFADGLFADFGALVDASEERGDDLVIALGGDNAIRIENLALSALRESDIVFA